MICRIYCLFGWGGGGDGLEPHSGAEDGLQDERNISNQSASFHYHISTTYVRIKYCLICRFKESAFFAKASAFGLVHLMLQG